MEIYEPMKMETFVRDDAYVTRLSFQYRFTPEDLLRAAQQGEGIEFTQSDDGDWIVKTVDRLAA